MLTRADMPPGYVLVNSAQDDLYIEDADNPSLFIDAGVQDRTLRFEIRAEERFTGNRSFVRGNVLFALMMRHFGTTFDLIASLWLDGTNLERFNRATAGGMTEADAGWATWTGELAIAYGFTRLTVEETIGGPGRYGLVRVWYYR